MPHLCPYLTSTSTSALPYILGVGALPHSVEGAAYRAASTPAVALQDAPRHVQAFFFSRFYLQKITIVLNPKSLMRGSGFGVEPPIWVGVKLFLFQMTQNFLLQCFFELFFVTFF